MVSMKNRRNRAYPVLLAMAFLALSCNDQKEAQMSDGRPLATVSSFYLSEIEQADLVKKANKKDNEASFKLYQYYQSVKLDSTQGGYWLRKSAEDGNVTAQYSLAVYAEESDNIEEALYWYKIAANNGDTLAKKELEELERELKTTPSKK
jgi:TPR repeat protein